MFHVKQFEKMIRTANLKDAEHIAKIYRPYVEKTAITFEYEPPSKEEMARRIEKTLERYPYLVFEENEEVSGYAYAGEYKERAAYAWAAEVSVYVREDSRGKGIGKSLYTEMEKILAAQNILNLYACITVERKEDRSASMVFHEHMGYELIGRLLYSGNKFGKWYDTVCMEKMLGEHFENPPEVIPFEDLCQYL